MKNKILCALTALMLSATAAIGGTYSNNGIVVSVEPVYRSGTPIYQEQCYLSRKNVKSSNTGNVITGMVIGGALGKGITGKNEAAAVGALLGGIIASDSGSTKSYLVEHCNNVLIGYENVLLHYLVTYRHNGTLYQEKTYRSFYVGQTIYVD
jgi:uncharacterized protein YcfJ